MRPCVRYVIEVKDRLLASDVTVITWEHAGDARQYLDELKARGYDESATYGRVATAWVAAYPSMMFRRPLVLPESGCDWIIGDG